MSEKKTTKELLEEYLDTVEELEGLNKMGVASLEAIECLIELSVKTKIDEEEVEEKTKESIFDAEGNIKNKYLGEPEESAEPQSFEEYMQRMINSMQGNNDEDQMVPVKRQVLTARLSKSAIENIMSVLIKEKTEQLDNLAAELEESGIDVSKIKN